MDVAKGQPAVVWISAGPLNIMASEASRWAPCETGGILVGYWAAPDEAVITYVVDGGPNAQRTNMAFEPDAPYQEARLAELYERSGRLDAYLGDWHSHPTGSLGLSRRDRKTLRTIGREPSARCPRPLMLLLAGRVGGWGSAVWVGGRGPLGVVRPHRALLRPHHPS